METYLHWPNLRSHLIRPSQIAISTSRSKCSPLTRCSCNFWLNSCIRNPSSFLVWELALVLYKTTAVQTSADGCHILPSSSGVSVQWETSPIQRAYGHVPCRGEESLPAPSLKSLRNQFVIQNPVLWSGSRAALFLIYFSHSSIAWS